MAYRYHKDMKIDNIMSFLLTVLKQTSMLIRKCMIAKNKQQC